MTQVLLVDTFFVSAVLAVGFLPFVAVGFGFKTGAVASYGTVAVFALGVYVCIGVGIDSVSVSRVEERKRGHHHQYGSEIYHQFFHLFVHLVRVVRNF